METALMRSGDVLPRYGFYAGFLAFAGLPIYIHAPKFFADEYGVSLAAIGAALLSLRLIDFLQDPLLGRLVDRLGTAQAAAATVAAGILALAMLALFAVTPVFDPLIWFFVVLAVLFTCFSFLTILFYAQGVGMAPRLGPGGHVRIAGWRESGSLVGVCLASVVPTVLTAAGVLSPMTGFAVLFAGLALVAAGLMHPVWSVALSSKGSLRAVLRDAGLRRLVAVGLFNAAPIAVTSTLFLFYVDHRLQAEALSGPLLVLFFLSAAISVPLWSRLADRIGPKRGLIWGMSLSVVAFAFAVPLGVGDVWVFGLVCIASGAALGADMTLLPALFATRIEAARISGGQAFGLWNFCTKFTLALAAATVLPILDFSGFDQQGTNTAGTLLTLSLLYAVLPCILKLLAIGILAGTNLEEV
jgi:GPH family glycoside/pentoside/hexuronide:cation symporter